MTRYLIVNADDFGLSTGVNHGIARAHEQGVVTSASLMVLRPGAEEAAVYARSHPQLSIGLHVELGEWSYDEWRAIWELPHTRAIVADEVARQLARFHELVERNPTHLDSHQHVHRDEPASSILLASAEQLDVPLRFFSPKIHYCGDFYGQLGTGEPLPGAIEVEALLELIAELPRGITELGCHPGDDPGLESSYRLERSWEVATLCDPRVKAALADQGVELRSFADVAG